jgi:hypothetical protein
VKNITVSVDEETYRRARSKAAERDSSLSALVKKFLMELVSEESAEHSLERQERDLRAQIRDFSARSLVARGRSPPSQRVMPRFLDTNILLYSISQDSSETAKRDRAVGIIVAGDNALSVQFCRSSMFKQPARRGATGCRTTSRRD